MIFQINNKYKKPKKSDVLEFQNIPVSMISDSMGNLNTMDSGINMMFKDKKVCGPAVTVTTRNGDCLLYTSPSPRDGLLSRMPSSA